MASSNKTRNDQEKKKMVIKLGGGGGGIGAVLLFGGALATAALASAFVVGVKARSSTKDRSRRDQNPPPENNKQTEEDAANKGQVIISTDHQHSPVFEHPSKGAKKEVESYNGTETFLVSTRSLILDEKDNIEINGGTPGDVDEETQIELIKVDAGNDGAEREKNGDGEIEVMSFREGVEVSGTQTRQEENGVEGVQIDQTASHGENMELNMEKEEVEGLYSCIDGEICEEKKCVEVVGSAKVGLCKHGSNQEGINNIDSMSDIVVSESHIGGEEEEKEILMSEYESSIIEHETVDGGLKESAFRAETVEIVQEDEALGESREDQVKYVNEKLVEEGTIVQMIEELIHEDTEVRKEDAANSDVIDGLEACENKTLIECDAMKNVKKEVEEELIYHENTEATTDDIISKEADGTTEESEDKNRQKDEQEEEEEEDGLTKESSNEEEEEGAYVNDEIEEEGSVETCDSSTGSNSGAVWPAESLKVKMVKYEVDGKIEEDKTVEEDEDDNQRKYERSNDSSSKKSFIIKYMVEKGMVIGILLLISWSWFFGFSWVTLCLVLFLTMLLSEIHGY